MIRLRVGNKSWYIEPICEPVIYTTTWIEIGTCSYMGFNILFDVRRFTPCSIPIIHRNTLWLQNSLILFNTQRTSFFILGSTEVALESISGIQLVTYYMLHICKFSRVSRNSSMWHAWRQQDLKWPFKRKFQLRD